MDKDAFNWTGGLISAMSAAAGGALSGSLGPMLADPKDFNFGDGMHRVFLVAGITALITTIIAILNYLAKSPLPGWSSITTTQQTTVLRSDPQPMKIVTTVAETHIEQMDSAGKSTKEETKPESAA